MALTCGFLLFDGFSNMVLASAVEPLRAARDFAGKGSFGWRLLSPDGGDVSSSSDIHIRCDTGLQAGLDGIDILFVVAGYGARRHATPATASTLRKAVRRVPVAGALDCGAWLLASAGLLDGHRATLHWQEIEQFAEQFLDVEVVSDRYALDRNRLTAGDATAVVDLMLRLIGDSGGGALAFDVASMFAQTGAHMDQTNPRRMRSPQMLRAVKEMRAHVEAPIDVADIARAAAVSPRTLARLFQREFGVSPGRYYQAIRLEAARALAAETPLRLSDIAARCGFASASTLSRAFAAHFGAPLRKASGRRGTSEAGRG